MKSSYYTASHGDTEGEWMEIKCAGPRIVQFELAV